MPQQPNSDDGPIEVLRIDDAVPVVALWIADREITHAGPQQWIPAGTFLRPPFGRPDPDPVASNG